MIAAPLKVLDLFSGIGGFSLGLERTGGFETVAFCEIEPFCRKVLAKHWPDVPIYEDVRTLTGERLAADGIAVDVITGGFPCQDISAAGRKAGIDGERSGLWAEYARLIREIRPRFAIVENVSDILGRGMVRVVGDLAEIGLAAEWHAIPACALGAPHERDRIWIIAHAESESGRRGVDEDQRDEAHGRQPQNCAGAGHAADAAPLLWKAQLWEQQNRAVRSHWRTHWRDYAASLRGMDDGVSGRVDGLASLGNAVIPYIPEMIGRAILQAEAA
jgi:DNA (cytosine-5)-methyltransferase 1